MFTSKYDSYSKTYTIYKDNKKCAIIRSDILTLEPNSIFNIGEISDMLDTVYM